MLTAAEDRDTPAENLTFAILSATAGHVALATSPATAIDRFTQVQINSQQLLFVHSGQFGMHLHNIYKWWLKSCLDVSSINDNICLVFDTPNQIYLVIVSIKQN